MRFATYFLCVALAASAPAALTSLGNVDAIVKQGSNVLITSGENQLRIMFYSPTTVRVWLADTDSKDNFTDPGSVIIVGKPDPTMAAQFADKGSHYEITSGSSDANAAILTVQKKPLLFAMKNQAGKSLWEEKTGISWNSTKGKTTTFQTLAPTAEETEYFFGGGMQNGRFSHTGHMIKISTSDNWANGGNPNSAPFYVSSAGYGVLRSSWEPGWYDFSQPNAITTAHNESRFDAYYFAGDFAAVLDSYTRITGRPFMIPIYGLGLGDSDCYHNSRHGNSTQVVISVADAYRANDMPGSWILPNDGYGCGYGEGPEKFPTDFKDLDLVVAELHKRNFYTGLWSSTGLPNIAREVNGSGVRVGKTDVGWIGSGYKYAFDSVQLVADGIEKNSDGRRFIWTVEGWAGTQRNAVMWTGDDSGSFKYIEWQIPTFVGSGFSAQAHVSGDIDGIFGGSPHSYVRDLQFKCLMTSLMVMSGWAGNPDKQPWTWGEPYTTINRMYLKLKYRLMPYHYSYSRIAVTTGMPPIRAMALQFPQDRSVYCNHTGSSMQFMSGEWILVAPVYRDETHRDGIYLPNTTKAATPQPVPPGPAPVDAPTDEDSESKPVYPNSVWIDYWNGTRYDGNQTIDGYDAPLDKLPMFVREGAIIPMWPPLEQQSMVQPLSPLTLELFPSGNTSFELYEDDGVTRYAGITRPALICPSFCALAHPLFTHSSAIHSLHTQLAHPLYTQSSPIHSIHRAHPSTLYTELTHPLYTQSSPIHSIHRAHPSTLYTQSP
jgi:alpha-glucosidase (family GH31 glycosyl hydrolase)